ncbi:MAG: hypothetical protein IKJ37_01135 [Kiritimatiellae bacterium]|nr:hypothetical protein [Kiritimatiellia bacterium]
MSARSINPSPPRNCDVGTAEEQEERFMRHCELHYKPSDAGEDAGCRGCPVFTMPAICEFAWSQLSCEAEEGDKEPPND